ncbi:Uncharacterized protein J7T55_002456 [Diaporthe amygdali]|uniref:uncharacterized protein n=1 Tax=Phomopsis amygdali TaxID=1214568 RepID=UPI0022FDB8F2|nr:uncharacterized protein J7T55_002456 [Diaporthe amygdali]KAJ0121945.1 Uncharacterized protein J7T55_002456 [Diaporthe amygdali]
MGGPKHVKLKSRKFPVWLRMQVWAGSILYRGENAFGQEGQTFRLPLNRVLKAGCHRNELDAMEFVRSRTSIPVPRVLELYEFGERYHLVMEMASSGPGEPGVDYDQMTPEQIKSFGAELGGYIQQLRQLEPPEEGVIGSVKLGKNHDSRLDNRAWGPFHGIADFHTYLRRGHPLAHWEMEPDVIRVHTRPEQYSIKFTHADLRPNNILIKDGHITAIIDWEFAGWYPEYWEYTKMRWTPSPFWDNFYKAVEQEPSIVKYPEELAAETAIWKLMHPYAYDDPPWSEENDAVQARHSAA